MLLDLSQLNSSRVSTRFNSAAHRCIRSFVGDE